MVIAETKLETRALWLLLLPQLPSSVLGKEEVGGHREAEAGRAGFCPSSATISSVIANSVSSSVKWN